MKTFKQLINESKDFNIIKDKNTKYLKYLKQFAGSNNITKSLLIDGGCIFYAAWLQEKVKNSKIYCFVDKYNDQIHYFVKFDELYYDGWNSNGVKNPIDLQFYKLYNHDILTFIECENFDEVLDIEISELEMRQFLYNKKI
jgi:hypothetical protein